MKKLVFVWLISLFYVFFIFAYDNEHEIKVTEYIEKNEITDFDIIQNTDGNCFLIYQNQFYCDSFGNQIQDVSLPVYKHPIQYSEVVIYKNNHFNSDECKKINFTDYDKVYATSAFYKVKENENYAFCFTGNSSDNSDKKLFIFAVGQCIKDYYTDVISFSHDDDLDIKSVILANNEISIFYLINQNLCMTTIDLQNGNETHKFIFSGYNIDDLKVRRKITKEQGDDYYGIFTTGNDMYSFLVKEDEELITQINFEYTNYSDCFYDFADEIDSCFVIFSNNFYEINFTNKIDIFKFENKIVINANCVKKIINSIKNAVIISENGSQVYFQDIDLERKQVNNFRELQGDRIIKILFVDNECYLNNKPYIYILRERDSYSNTPIKIHEYISRVYGYEIKLDGSMANDDTSGGFYYTTEADRFNHDAFSFNKLNIDFQNIFSNSSDVTLVQKGLCYKEIQTKNEIDSFGNIMKSSENLITKKYEICLERNIDTGKYYYAIRENGLKSFSLLKKDWTEHLVYDLYKSTDTINGLFYVFRKIGSKIEIISRMD